VLCARSIKPLRVAAGGCGGRGLTADPNLTAMGIQSLFVCSLVILRDLQTIRGNRKSQLKAPPCGMTR